MSSSKIKKALKNRDLAEAFKILSKRISELGNYDLQNAIDDAQTTYRAMLTYMLNGYVDNDLATRKDELVRNLFSINDRADRLERIQTAEKQSRYINYQKMVDQKTNLSNICQRLEVDLPDDEYEDETCNLFYQVWTSDVWTKGNYDTATELLNSNSTSLNAKAVFISAITLSLMEMFDAKKLHLLFDAYLSPSSIINQRALVGIILTIRIYDSRLECFPDILSRLEIYADDPRFVKEMYSALLMLQYSSITDKIVSKMQNDIMPLLTQKYKGIKKMSNKELMEELTRNGENPEWTEDNKLAKGIKEMGNLQLEGADVHLSTFRYMKGSSFFNKIPHWFYLFDINSPLLNGAHDSAKSLVGDIVDLVLKNHLFCDSDSYSFFFMLKGLSGIERSMIQEQMSSQMPEEDMNALREYPEKNLTNKDVCRMYIFNLYRFFNIYPFFNQFDNPFKAKKRNADGTEKALTFSPLETKAFSFLLNERKELTNLAEFFMRKGFYEEALEIYDIINPQQQEEDASLWQKIGFCRQKLGKDKAAYKTYLLADSLLPDSKWTMTHIAQLAQKLEIYDTARNYYEMLLLQDSENMKFIVNKAICQMKLAEYEDALTTLFKANYLDEESVDVRAMMAECYVMTGNIEKAQERLKSLFSNIDCPVEMRILNALIALKTQTMEATYDYIRESLYIYKESSGDPHPFIYHYTLALNKYTDYLNIDKNIAQMILDSVYLDIR